MTLTKKAKTAAGKAAVEHGKKKKADPRLNTRFKMDQQVVYPLQGVGKILSIEERTFKDSKLLYYIIYLEVSDMTVMIPVDKAEELGIRAIVGRKDAEEALKAIGGRYEAMPADWKARYQMNLDLLKQGSVVDIAKVVKMLYHRSKIKELPILERKLFDNALKLLVDEISFSLNMKKDEVEAAVFNKLESELPEKLKSSVVVNNDADDEDFAGLGEEPVDVEDDESY